MPIVIAYLNYVTYERGSLKQKEDLAPGTIAGYMNSACNWFKTALGLKCHEVNTKQGMIADLLLEASKWRKPKPKREPYTYAMFETLQARVAKQLRSTNAALLHRDAAVLDWARLSIFTGSRSGEYAQTVGTTTKPSRVPDAPAAGVWAKTPIAFIASDFAFYAADGRRLRKRDLLRNPQEAVEVHVRFRFDKSGRNFTIRKFRRGKGLICPVEAAISILARAVALKVPATDPIGVFLNPRAKKAKNQVVLLQSKDVVKVMRSVCLETYPDPNHYYHIHHMSIDAHSARVTAAVALSNAGVPKAEIAFRLRWKPESVDHYLRDCQRTIGSLTEAAILGSMNIT